MELLCYNKGCGERFDGEDDSEDACLFHPGVPIFHDALKGCTRGRHSNEKPQEPLRPEVSSDKGGAKTTNGEEIIYQGPKSAETLQRERPSSQEPLKKLPKKVSASLAQTFQGPETDLEVCTHHPGAPVFHEGYKYWSCCCIQTFDFNAFLDQKGCSAGTHRWIPKQDKKKVACRQDWHQTANTVFVTIYAKNANPEFSLVEANRTVIRCDIQFENNKLYKKEFHLWGVVDVKRSSVSMVPTKVEVSLRKADAVAWGKLEDPNFKAEPEVVDVKRSSVSMVPTKVEVSLRKADAVAWGKLEDPNFKAEPEVETPGESAEPPPPEWDIDDDDISDSDEEWRYDKPPKKPQGEGEEEEEANKEKKDGGEEEKETTAKQEAEEKKKRAEEEEEEEEEKERKKWDKNAEEDGLYDDLPPLDD
ncbi:hypothetical protein CRUP_011830 [Coryphaenoides rupestris]|nr:hypothetical protein CRUP_011830 [Coryphaenoides rupestris]